MENQHNEDLEENYVVNQRLGLFEMNLKLLSVTGIVPNRNITCSKWKLKTYRLLQFLSLLIYIPVLILQVLGLCFYWGNITLTTDNICITCSLLIGYIPALYQAVHAENLHRVIDMIEQQSLFSMKAVKENSAYTTIVNDAKKTASYLTWLTSISLSVTGILWTSYPLVMHYFQNNSSDDNSLDHQFKYLVFVMWLPFEISQPDCYRLTYLLQVIVFLTAMAYIIGILTLYLNIMVYLKAQLKIVTAAIRELDKAYFFEKEEDMNQGHTFEYDKQFRQEIVQEVINETYKNKENRNTLQAVEESDIVRKSEDIQLYSIASLELLTTKIESNNVLNGEENSDKYIVQCIKFHQSAISFSKEANNILGFGLIVAIVCNVVLIITETFQLSLVVTTKYCSGFFTSLTQQFIFSYFGQGIINQSLAVGAAVYKVKWYCLPVRFQRLLLLILARAQNPVKITFGKIFPLSLILFTQVLNVSYKFYTVLLQVNDP
ncbi:Odorant receptor 31 [Blattella germanica]|nr:Odorant receptor 31 [Blattella germanica]